MKLIRVDKLTGNEILAVPVVSDSDAILIQSDTILRDEYINRLLELNIRSVYIKDEVSDQEIFYKVEETTQRSRQIVKQVLERHIYKHNEELKKVGEAAEKILNSVLEEPKVVTGITEIRNISTDMYSHCINVCALATIMAVRLKMTEKQVKNVATGSILHDIGLRYIQAPYMNCNIEDMSAKDALEYKKHTIYGFSSLENETWLSDTAKEIILYHHERIDGTGYPFRLNGDKLKNEVRLVAVCSDFDSLISGVGAEQLKMYQAIEYIKVHSGEFYDANITAKLLESIAVYPIGMHVITNEGEMGIVIAQNKEMTDRPVIRMLRKSDGTEYVDDIVKDLGKILTLFIVDTE